MSADLAYQALYPINEVAMTFASNVSNEAASPYTFLAYMKERSIETGLFAVTTLATPAPSTVLVSG